MLRRWRLSHSDSGGGDGGREREELGRRPTILLEAAAQFLMDCRVAVCDDARNSKSLSMWVTLGCFSLADISFSSSRNFCWTNS